MPRPEKAQQTNPYAGFELIKGVAEGAQALAVRQMLSQELRPCLFITHHDKQLTRFVETAPFFLPEVEVVAFPAWDTLPYDRSPPSRVIVAERVAALVRMLALAKSKRPFVVATTVNAFMQKLPPASLYANTDITLKVNESLDHDTLAYLLSEQGYRRASKVMEAGEFALRGSIIDIFPANAVAPCRIDMFGDTIESIKAFDPLSQRSEASFTQVEIAPTSELLLSEERITHFRKAYRAAFGQPHRDDALYHTVSEGNHYAGMEHWLPLFYEKMATLLDYLPNAQLCLDSGIFTTFEERNEIIEDYYQARIAAKDMPKAAQGGIYHPVPPEQFYLLHDWKKLLAAHKAVVLDAFDAAEADTSLKTRPVKNLFAVAKTAKLTPFEMLAQELQSETRPIVLAASSAGSGERLAQLCVAQHLPTAKPVRHLDEVARSNQSGLFLAQLPLQQGFQSPHYVLYTEQDVLGQRIIQSRKRRKQSDAFMAEAAAFDIGELLVHKDHGIGQFDGLVTVEVNGHKHDCLKLLYKDNDRLFVPVENMDLITRHGGEAGDAELDKLGGGSWQARKAAYKEKLRLTAEALLKTAALRELCHAEALQSAEDVYADFVARFPYEETEDQLNAIEDVLADLRGSKPMDRLICGDVGFGKTEVALRAAFVAATDVVKPTQVAFIAPTTLLVRQHYHTFKQRFADSGLNVAQLSRLCSAKEAAKVKEGLADGSIDVVIGTHALLADSVKFKHLGLLIIDEEQRFGVKQKEKLKAMRTGIHVLTMSATPIPRTLQMSLTGVRDLSLITTPPVDRLAIRSFVMPFDPVVIKEALKRELHRGGQVFYVTPRIADLPELTVRIRELVPEARLAVAHGQMSASELDSIMNDVYDGKYDVLLSTTIIESGIDIPNANTMIIHRADRFGLAQLYQLRGRVGRGKVRAYAYFTLPYHGAMSAQAVKRLEVMQSLDTLGAGFTIASHDMDIRGFGNLVGEEQSGHVKDVGIELYQQMLSDAVRQARAERQQLPAEALDDEAWSPQLNLGLSVMIPESYVEDLSLRLSLYRRAATLETAEEIESFAAELADRFGSIPEETEHLFTTLKLKQLCKAAGIARIDTGPKGAVLHFHESAIKKPEALIGYISRHANKMKLRADQSVFYAAEWKEDSKKLTELRQLIGNMQALQG